jgi:hypothetical protein
MSSFATIMESLKLAKDEKRYRESLATRIIKKGNEIDENFWENFLILLEDPEALSVLFHVSESKAASWYGKIKAELNKGTEDSYEIQTPSKRRIIKT